MWSACSRLCAQCRPWVYAEQLNQWMALLCPWLALAISPALYVQRLHPFFVCPPHSSLHITDAPSHCVKEHGKCGRKSLDPNLSSATNTLPDVWVTTSSVPLGFHTQGRCGEPPVWEALGGQALHQLPRSSPAAGPRCY